MLAVELAEYQLQVGAVVAVLARPASRQDAWHAVQRVHCQSRVVRDRGQAGVRGDRARLEQRVVREGAARFRHVRRTGELVESDKLAGEPGIGEYPVELGDLVRIARREDNPVRRISHE
jgi:hypothetical protein